jgi:hypothetical protein
MTSFFLLHQKDHFSYLSYETTNTLHSTMSSDLAKLPPSGLSSAKEPPMTSTLKDVANQQESSSPVATKKAAAAATISKPAATVVTPNNPKTPTVPRTLLDTFI